MNKTFTLFLSFCFCLSSIVAQITITEARENNPDGSLAREGQTVQLTGIAIGPNLRPGGFTFLLYDVSNSIGITVFTTDNTTGYSVTDGDELTVEGVLEQFNGLAEIEPTSIAVNSQGNTVPDPVIVTDLDETSESNLVTYKNAMLEDVSKWKTSGSFNVFVTNGTSTIQVRIDSDTDISGMEAPLGSFDITGMGGQFDSDAPYDSGYQLFPRFVGDISPYNTTEIVYEKMSISEARQTDGDGILTRLDDRVELTGIVYGINLRPEGLQFTIIDATNTGIAVFSFSDSFGYTVNESDEITVKGELSQFGGLAEISPDSISVLSTGNDLVTPLEVNQLNESTESSLVTINALQFVDPTQWLGDGTSFDVDVITDNGDTLLVRIDNDTETSTMSFPGCCVYITGIGGQFDTSAPHDSGYQLQPRYPHDFMPYLGTNNLYVGEVNVYPNPSSGTVNIEAEDKIISIFVYDNSGRKITEVFDERVLNLSNYSAGTYYMKIHFDDAQTFQKLMINK